MNQVLKEGLAAGGIDGDDVMERLMGNEKLLERLMKKFLQDENFPALQAALEAGDVSAAVSAAHTLKGMCSSLSMSVLTQLLTCQVVQLRADDLAGATALMPQIIEAYTHATEAIRRCWP